MSEWQVDVARARWRADLWEYTAAALDSVGLTDDADAKRAKIKNAREFADACERFETLKATARDTPEYEAARAEFIALRTARRVAKGGPVDNARISSVNNFSEPSDDELVGGAA